MREKQIKPYSREETRAVYERYKRAVDYLDKYVRIDEDKSLEGRLLRGTLKVVTAYSTRLNEAKNAPYYLAKASENYFLEYGDNIKLEAKNDFYEDTETKGKYLVTLGEEMPQIAFNVNLLD